MRDKIIEEQTTAVTANEKKKQPAKQKISNFFCLTFLLITITLLIAVSSYCYLIKYQNKNIYCHFTLQMIN